MLEQYYIIGSNQDGPMKYLTGYGHENEFSEDHREANMFESPEDIHEKYHLEPFMVLRVTIEKATP